MIDLTAMNNKPFTLNADHIEKIEEVPGNTYYIN